MRLATLLLAALAVAGCAARRASVPPPPDLAPAGAELREPPAPGMPGRDYIDLKPGWRLSVVTPLLKSGGYRLNAVAGQVSGNTVTLAAGDELEGYETAYYAVEPGSGGGVRIAFTSAHAIRGGEKVEQLRARAPLFELPPEANLVRLIYLTRVSSADHDMAVVAAADVRALNRLTREVQTSPDGCRSDAGAYCAWVPSGIAVRPEMLAGDWVPAR
jgi:hypothetical protein